MVLRSVCQAAVLVSLLAGCSPGPKSPATAPSSATTNPASGTEPTNEASALEDSQPGQAEPESSDTESEQPVATSVVAATSAGSEETVPTVDRQLPSTRRLLLLGPDGPLLIELVLTIDGQPFDAPMRRLIDEAMRAADTNDDGVPTWDELTASSAFRYGTYGNQPIATMAERQTVKTTYDGGGGDGRVARHEMVRYLNSNQGGGEAFAISSSNQYRGDNQSRSLVKQLLDWDEDGSLSADELQAAAQRLRSRDSDEDDILFLDDFKATSNMASPFAQPNMRARLKRYGPDAAILLDDNTNWNNLLVSFKELYTLGGNVGPEAFAMTPATFTQLDADQNGVLQVTELAALLSVEPHVSLSAQFGGAPESPLELRALSTDLEQLQPVVTKSPGRVALTLPGVELLVYVTDAAPQEDFERQAQAQLMALDTDSNGYLDEAELMAGGAGQFPLAAVDSDGDGKVFLPELRDLLSRRQNASRSQLRAYAADQEDALFTALDANNDGRLTTREIDGAAELLRQLDRNQDGRLSASEIPGSLQVAITRGAAMMNNVPPAPAYLESPPTGNLPAWFQHMDANQDGDVSRLEFLGERETFDRLDTNQDGFISGEEAGGRQS